MRVPRIGRTSNPALKVGLGGVAVVAAGGMSMAWLADRVGGIIDGLGGPVALHPSEPAEVGPDGLDEAALPSPRTPGADAEPPGPPADRLVHPRRPADQDVPRLSAQRVARPR